MFDRRPWMAMMALLFLTACGPSADYADLDVFMKNVDAKPKGNIKPLPPIETVPPFSYLASNQRSPFEPPVVLKRVERQSGGPKVEPDLNRVKQYLERYSISQLSMVGTLAQGDATFALVQDNDGGVHRVQVGDFIGADHGKVRVVGETSIELVEIVPDGTGGWVERERTVALANGA